MLIIKFLLFILITICYFILLFGILTLSDGHYFSGIFLIVLALYLMNILFKTSALIYTIDETQ